MRYISTRGRTAPLEFQNAVLAGLAPDGGLLLPSHLPDLSGELDELAGLGFADLAKAVLPRFISDIAPRDLDPLVDAAYQSFDYPEVGAFSLVMHSFFVLMNALIGLAFLPQANKELFGGAFSQPPHPAPAESGASRASGCGAPAPPER